MVASLPRPRSEPCALQYLATLPPSTKPALPRVPTSPGHQLADAANLTPRPADSTTSAPALPPPRRSISSFNPFALPMTDAAVEALRPYRRISMSTKRRHRASMQGARQSVTLQREREPMRALTQADAAPLQRDSGVSTASAATRKSDGSRSGRDGPASLWEHVVAQSQSGLQSAHNSLVSAGGAPRRSSEESEMARFQHAGRVRSFMHAPPPAASSGMARLASEPAARMSNDSEHSAAAAALRQPTTPGGATRALPRQLSAPDRATAVLALLHNSEALPSCSGSASGHTDTDGSLTEDDARGVLGAAAATPSACFASALYATARHTQPSASASSTSSAAHNSLKVGATSTDYSSASRAPSVPSSVFGSMSAVEMSVDAPRASSVSGAEGGAQAPAKVRLDRPLATCQRVGVRCVYGSAHQMHRLQACAEEEQQSRVQRARDEHFARDLNMRVGRARQTMDYAASQRCRFSRLQIATLTVWQALDLFNELRCARAGPHATPSRAVCPMPQQLLTSPIACSPDPATGHTPADTAFLACEWCVHEFPEFEWAPLVSLVHDMGRLLTHPLCAPRLRLHAGRRCPIVLHCVPP